MKVSNTNLEGVLVLEGDVYRDNRGHFLEMWNAAQYKEYGVPGGYVQDNVSLSEKNVLRGLHFQYPKSQSKLVTVLAGEVFDVAVDIRKGSPTFGEWFGLYLSSVNKKQLYIPAGFAHGFCVISDRALLIYKCDDYYSKENEHTILWSDKSLDIDWPISQPILSQKDTDGFEIATMDQSKFPVYKT